MQFTIFIYETAADFAARSDPRTQKASLAVWPPYTQALREAGVLVGGSGLQQPETAATIRTRNDQREVHDGPYADTSEQLGGYVIVDVPSMDEALAWAARCPCQQGVIEVRPHLPPLPVGP